MCGVHQRHGERQGRMGVTGGVEIVYGWVRNGIPLTDEGRRSSAWRQEGTEGTGDK